jgi:hypothetical protein
MFIFLEKDYFAGQAASGRAFGSQNLSGEEARFKKERSPIRRPYRGIQIKKDTYAVLSVRGPSGDAIPLYSSSAIPDMPDEAGPGRVNEYSDFILQQVQDQRMEKQQIIETFGDTFVYLFGERPRIVTFSGQLVNTEDFNWRAQFWYNYDHYFRGTRLVQLNARCYLAYDSIVLEGYPLSAVASDDAENPYQVSFSVTMLLTDYHESSTIGETHFPSAGIKDYEILNQELDKERSTFVSTTLEVRRHNFSASSSTQIPKTNSALAALRTGVQLWNQGASWLGARLGDINRTLGGRILRVPIGAASFLTLAAEGQLAVGSAIGSTSAVLTGFDQRTSGRFGTIEVNGVLIPGNKLMIMGPSKFAPSWVSEVTGTPRGMIWENRDEYPLSQQSSLKDMLTPEQYAKMMTAAEARNYYMRAFQQQLTLFNAVTASGSILSTIADVVSAIREGFGLLLTASNIVQDPITSITASVGTTPQDVKRLGEGLADGAFVPGISWFIGGAARKTWESWLDSIGSAQLGDVFHMPEYQTSGQDIGYELAYGDSNYQPLIESQQSIDAAVLATEGDLPDEVSRTESNAGRIAQALSEVYGDTDNADYGDSGTSPSSIAEVYGQGGTVVRTQPTGEERAQMIQETYNGDSPVTDVDTSGITAADSDSAPIDPAI